MKKFVLFLIFILFFSCQKENLNTSVPIPVSFSYTLEQGSMYNTRSLTSIISQLPIKTDYYLTLKSNENTYLLKVDFTQDSIFSIQPGKYHITNTVQSNIYELDVLSKRTFVIDTYVEITDQGTNNYILPAKYDCSIIAADSLETERIEFSCSKHPSKYNVFKYDKYILYICKRDPVICNKVIATIFPKNNKYEKTNINIDAIEFGKYYILHPNLINNNSFQYKIDDFIEGTL
jgi:hypothetical protein